MTAAVVLRGYQAAALDRMRDSLARVGVKRLLLYSPTGSGKTEIGIAMIQGALDKGRKVAFIANRKELVRQASRRLARAGIDHGIVQAENTVNLSARVLVCSIDTVASRGLPDDIDLLIIDEAHGVAGNVKYRNLLFQYNAVPVVGLSATPFTPGLGKHYDELNGPLFQELVQAASIRELIDQGYLVDVDVFAPASPDLAGVKTQKGIHGEIDYNETQLADAVDKPSLVGDVVQHWKRLANGKPTVCFACNIAHSQHLADAFNAAGIAAAHIDYHHDDEERAEILAAFNNGTTTVLCNASLLAEGWDAPHATCMILARPTKSLTRFIQMAGRVLRPFPGKTRALLLDHSGSVVRLGIPTDDLPLELDDGKPRKAGTTAPRKSEPTPCPKCKFVRPPSVHICPACGFAPARKSEVEVQAGELVKYRKRPQAQDKQHIYSQLVAIANSRKYADGWVGNKFRDIFGIWPRGMLRVPVTPTIELLNQIRADQIRYAKSLKSGAQHGR
jgi:DNA repair protein RadD